MNVGDSQTSSTASRSSWEPRGATDQRRLRLARAAGRCGQGARKGKGMARSARRPGRQAQIARLLVGALAALLLACASVGTPPGGPPDKEAPKIVQVKPESGAVVPNWKSSVVIQYDEVIDEMASSGGGGGAVAGLAKQILLSPVQGPVKVDWHRSSISVKPKEGWKRRVYRLEILPGILDLRRNRSDSS